MGEIFAFAGNARVHLVDEVKVCPSFIAIGRESRVLRFRDRVRRARDLDREEGNRPCRGEIAFGEMKRIRRVVIENILGMEN